MEPSLSTRTRLNNVFRSVLKLPGFEPLVARITRGRVPTSLLARLAPNHYQYRPGSRRQVRRSGLELDLDISDFVDWHAYFGLADPGQDGLLGRIQPGQVVLDVGANNGYLTLRLAQRVGHSGRVIAFEPHPHNVARFGANHTLNTMEHVELVPMGLGDAEGESTMIEFSPANAGMNRMVPMAAQVAEAAKAVEAALADGTRVRVTTLDGFLREREMDSGTSPSSDDAALPINWIKIDVEGYEARVLRGATATIARCRPGLFIEVDDANLRAQGDSAAGLLKWVEAAGYEILDAATHRPITSGSPLDGCHLDALCIHPEGTVEAERTGEAERAES